MDNAWTSAINPTLSILSRTQVDAVHRRSCEVLSRTGIRVDASLALKVFTQSDAVQVQDDHVFLSPEIIDWALSVVPKSIQIHDRRGRPAFSLGESAESRTAFGIGVTNLFYQDVQTDGVSPFLRKHMIEGVKLGNALDEFDLISTLGVPQDLPESSADFYSGLDMLAGTVKPLVLLVSNDACFDPLLDLLEHLHGDLRVKPFVLPYFNPITPLVLNQGTAEKMVSAIRRGLPFVYNNYGMSGASTPITSLGSLVLLNAELLAGLVFSQLVQEGTPVVLGSLPAGFDMRSMISTYTPRTMLLNLACAEMMAAYQVPHSGTSGSCNGWGPDLSAAGTLWMNHLTSCLGKVGMAPFVGGNFDSMVFSPATVVYANDIIRQCRRFHAGLSFDELDADLEDIHSTGPAGDFLYSERTFALCRQVDPGGGLWPNLSLDAWQAKDAPKAEQWLKSRTEALLAEAESPEDQAEVLAGGEAYIRERLTGV
ncbi:MAG: trimethylamine methyltransferase family protein [Desulfohalobiaceae bacterium]|nr:trimethylamine methyltransferase family protein [Desulfohalobiaceae bacterium]